MTSPAQVQTDPWDILSAMLKVPGYLHVTRNKRQAERTLLDRSATQAIAFFEQHKARIVGITGDRSDAGTSEFASAVAAAYIAFGKRTLLVDATGAPELLAQAAIAPHSTARAVDLLAISQSHNGLAYVNLAEAGLGACGRGDLKAAFDATAAAFDTIVVELAPVLSGPGATARQNMTVGAACDQVLLMCISSGTTRDHLKDCLQACSIWGVPVSGLLLNDWRLPFVNPFDPVTE